MVGAGVAGYSAALAAAAAGARVLVVAKGDLDASNTGWAAGWRRRRHERRARRPSTAHVAGHDRRRAGPVRPGRRPRRSSRPPRAHPRPASMGAAVRRRARFPRARPRGRAHASRASLHARGDATGRGDPRHPPPRRAGVARRSTSGRRRFLVDLLTDEDGRCRGRPAADGAGPPLRLGRRRRARDAAGTRRSSARARTSPAPPATASPRRCAPGPSCATSSSCSSTRRRSTSPAFRASSSPRPSAARARTSSTTAAGASLQEADPRGELAPRDVVSRAILRQLARPDVPGRLPRHDAPGPRVRRPASPGIAAACRAHGLDLAQDRIPVRPAAHYSIGGVACRPRRRPRASPGSSRAGEVAASGLHGANRLASNSPPRGARPRSPRGARRRGGRRRPSPPRALHLRGEGTGADAAGNLDEEDLRASLRALLWRMVGIERHGGALTGARRGDRRLGGLRPARRPRRPSSASRCSTCSRRALASPRRRSCARRAGAPTSAATSPSATTRSGARTSSTGAVARLEGAAAVPRSPPSRPRRTPPVKVDPVAGPSPERPARGRGPPRASTLPRDPVSYDDAARGARPPRRHGGGRRPSSVSCSAARGRDASTFVGTGKAEEVGALAKALGADARHRRPRPLARAGAQPREGSSSRRVIDRTELILDIFAPRARSARGARPGRARAARVLAAAADAPVDAPLASGSGGRASARAARARRSSRSTAASSASASRDLQARARARCRATRDAQRRGRARRSSPSPSSATRTRASRRCFNRLTRRRRARRGPALRDARHDDARVATCGARRRVLLSDTVGFIRKLPHHLVASFRATLEEAREADLLLHVVDAHDPDALAHVDVVERDALRRSARAASRASSCSTRSTACASPSPCASCDERLPGRRPRHERRHGRGARPAGTDVVVEHVLRRARDVVVEADAGNGRLLARLREWGRRRRGRPSPTAARAWSCACAPRHFEHVRREGGTILEPDGTPVPAEPDPAPDPVRRRRDGSPLGPGVAAPSDGPDASTRRGEACAASARGHALDRQLRLASASRALSGSSRNDQGTMDRGRDEARRRRRRPTGAEPDRRENGRRRAPRTRRARTPRAIATGTETRPGAASAAARYGSATATERPGRGAEGAHLGPEPGQEEQQRRGDADRRVGADDVTPTSRREAEALEHAPLAEVHREQHDERQEHGRVVRMVRGQRLVDRVVDHLRRDRGAPCRAARGCGRT